MFDESILELLNALDEGITAIDNKGIIIFLNDKASAMDNIDLNSAIGRHVLEVYPSLSQKNSTLLNSINSGQAILDNTQIFMNYKGEKIVTINSTIPIRKNKKIIGALEISKDITQMNKLSEELIELKNQLILRDEIKKFTPGTNLNVKKYNLTPGTNLKRYTFVDIIGQSELMQEVKNYALKAAETSSSIVIYGETGTGKELFVQAIHNASKRREKPFVAQNCAALPATLLEGILFGTVKGSFTGAEDRPGLFELADGGTLYLDELNSMPKDLQAKLLRVIQDGIIRRVGDTNERFVDVRIIASTNIDPEICLKEGIIRSDLFYRISVITLEVPELKKRKTDIPILVKYFINKYNNLLNTNVQGVTEEVLEKFLIYKWPGNVRELEHMIEGILNIKNEGQIDLNNLPKYISDVEGKPLVDAINEHEKKILIDALILFENNISKASQYLQIPRQTLQYKMKKYSIDI